MDRHLWSHKLTGFRVAHSATILLPGMPGMSMRRVCGVELRAFVRRVVSCWAAWQRVPPAGYSADVGESSASSRIRAVLGIDLGTSQLKAVVATPEGRILGWGRATYPIDVPAKDPPLRSGHHRLELAGAEVNPQDRADTAGSR